MERDLDAYIQQQNAIPSDGDAVGESPSDVTHNATPPVDAFPAPGLTNPEVSAGAPQIPPQLVEQLLQDNARMREAMVYQAQEQAALEEARFFNSIQEMEPEEQSQALFYYEQAKSQQQIQALQTQLAQYQQQQEQTQEMRAKVQAAKLIADRAGLKQEQAPLLLAAATPQAMEALAKGLAQYAPRQANGNPYLATGDQPSGNPAPQVRKRSGDLDGLIASRTYR